MSSAAGKASAAVASASPSPSCHSPGLFKLMLPPHQRFCGQEVPGHKLVLSPLLPFYQISGQRSGLAFEGYLAQALGDVPATIKNAHRALDLLP